jgi:hypothetical protein
MTRLKWKLVLVRLEIVLEIVGTIVLEIVLDAHVSTIVLEIVLDAPDGTSR